MPGGDLKAWRATPEVVQQMAERAGRTLDQVMPAVTQPPGKPYWIVDRTHEAWTGISKAVVDAIAALRKDPESRWLAAFQRSYRPVTDVEAELQFIARLPNGMEVDRDDGTPCDCKAHWATYRQTHPPREAIATPAAYTAWLLAAKNAIADRLGRPTLAADDVAYRYPPVRPDRIVVLSLDSRPDRWAAVTASIQTSRILGRIKVERHRARLISEMIVPDWWRWDATMYATGVDHRAIIEQSYMAGDQAVLILEDDAILQEGFDQAYLLATRSLPADWMGLWLTSDGHKRPPIDIGPGLVRCTCQAMLHAYMLSRSGMHRAWHHLATRHDYIVDGATEDLHGIEPHFYATKINAVRQFGCRFKGQRQDFFDQYGEGQGVPGVTHFRGPA